MRQQFGPVSNHVALVDQQQHRSAHMFKRLENHPVFFVKNHAFYDKKYHVYVFEGFNDSGIHRAVQRLVLAFMQTRCIYIDILDITVGFDTSDTVSCCLRLAGGNTDFLLQQMVQQCGLAHIGTANNGNKTAAGHCLFSHDSIPASLSRAAWAAFCSASRRECPLPTATDFSGLILQWTVNNCSCSSP